jgi:hypothetical protein
MPHRIAAVAILSLVLATSARADWVVQGAAYKCDHRAGVFSIEAITDTSSPEDPGTVRAKPGFVELQPDKTRNIRCTLGRTAIQAKVQVVGPRERGMCSGSGSAYVHSLGLDGRAVLQQSEQLGTGCPSGPGLIAIRIHTGESPTVEFCRGDWEWGVGYKDIECHATRTPNHSIERTSSSALRTLPAAAHVQR